MRELCEFRLNEKHAHLLFGNDEGRRLGDTVRKILIATGDRRFAKIKRLAYMLETKDDWFFRGWNIEHRYTRKELIDAKLFNIAISAVFEPTGEECGTDYDESEACPQCGAGRKQASDLVLDLRKAPQKKGIARTIAGNEWIISQRLAELMVDAKLTGFDLSPVRHKARYQDDPVDLAAVPCGRKLLEQAKALGIPRHLWEFDVWFNRPEQKVLSDRAQAEHAELRAQKARRRWKPPPVWYQLVVTSKPVLIVPPTRTGIDPFDDDPEDEYKCPYGHVIGLNLLSEVSVERDEYEGADVVCTSNMIGNRMGLLVPVPCLLISPRFYQLLRKEKIKGYKSEIAYLV